MRQLDGSTRELLHRAWAAGLGLYLGADFTIDIDSSVVETYGLKKYGGQRFSDLGVRGHHPPRWPKPVSCCTPGCAAGRASIQTTA